MAPRFERITERVDVRRSRHRSLEQRVSTVPAVETPLPLWTWHRSRTRTDRSSVPTLMVQSSGSHSLCRYNPTVYTFDPLVSLSSFRRDNPRLPMRATKVSATVDRAERRIYERGGSRRRADQTF